MEYGGITPIGLPGAWRLLVDARVAEIELAIIGSGIRGSKLFLPGRLLGELPGAEVVADLGPLIPTCPPGLVAGVIWPVTGRGLAFWSW